MILYNPVDADIFSKNIKLQPRTCFVMTKLGEPVPQEIINTRKTLSKYLKQRGINEIDAFSGVTGKDMLLKIYEMIVSAPLGIGIIAKASKNFSSSTTSNIFYELGLMQALGKETLVIKTPGSVVPTDLVRTEYIEYSRGFKKKINQYLDTMFDQAEHYATLAGQFNKNPLHAIDYYRRAYLITGEQDYKDEAKNIFIKNIKSFDVQTAAYIENFVNS
ncbi:MAG: hypothetical protein COB85_06830 [Bacteroidetes bacterium]|nr:MAG: hypothetical protein COB85_06830 [Bacteroidota bacterium]